MHRFFVPPELLTGIAQASGNVGAPLADSEQARRHPGDGVPEASSEELIARFTVSPDAGSRLPTISLPKELAHQVRDVLRLSIGEQLLLLDNSGDEVRSIVTESGKEGVHVQLLERRKGKSESPVRIILCQGLLKSARFEWILEKGTELGVAAFAPILCRRSMAGLEDAGPSKQQRWQRIIQEAAEQCGRSRLPELLPARPLLQALNDIPPGAHALMPWEEEHSQTLREALVSALDRRDLQPVTVVLFIG